ncbi:alanine racemase [Nocardioides alcanivorans]|uniref:alanine racemase n=1 Tax=Nocardioides alcanivorans TaxID=2897352 RepID=UPI001F39DE0F|nr:alanine racemase [Nocardioides alcanivorans]
MNDLIEANRVHARLNEAVATRATPLPTPAMVVDLDAFDRNADDLVRRAGGTPIRVASKSLRVPALLDRALARAGFTGVLTYALREALWLHRERGLTDLVMGYPTVDTVSLAELVSSPSAAAAITLMVDSTEHLDIVDSLRSSKAVPIRVAIDVDAGLHLRGQHVGPKRSPLLGTDAVTALARAVVDRDGFTLVGVMTYEGQVAGLQDDVPGQRAKSLVVRRLKAASVGQLAERRQAVAEALARFVELEFWNAGGSGSIETSAADPVVTEVAAGSGLLVPTLFDHYRSFTPRPAAYFAVPVLRKPTPDVVTVAGGGFVASGAAGKDRLPTPWLPPGLSPTGTEGVGEVQTP